MYIVCPSPSYVILFEQDIKYVSILYVEISVVMTIFIDFSGLFVPTQHGKSKYFQYFSYFGLYSKISLTCLIYIVPEPIMPCPFTRLTIDLKFDDK